MAGSFGYEAEHYEVSMQMAERKLLPAVRASGPETLVAAAGVSCRHQIKQGSGRRALHPAEVLRRALLDSMQRTDVERELDPSDPYAREAQTFPRLSEEAAQRVANYGVEQVLRKGVRLFERGQRGVDFFLLLEGNIEIFDVDEQGAPKVLTVHGERQFTGELDLFNDRQILVSGRTGMTSRLIRVKRADFRKMLAAEPDIGVLGPMGRDAADLALGLDVLAGAEGADAKAWRLALPPARHERLHDFRVGVWLDHPLCPIDAEVGERLQGAVDAIARAGARIDANTKPVDGAEAFSVYLRLLFGVLGNGFPPAALAGFDAALPGLADATGTQADIVRGVAQRHRDWVVIDERRQRMRLAWDAYFADHDVLLAPVMPTVAFPHDHSEYTTRTIAVNGMPQPYIHQLFWAGLTNVVYLPAVAAPVGFARSGLPVGIQITAPYLEDRTAIRFAALLADEIGGVVAPPGFE